MHVQFAEFTFDTESRQLCRGDVDCHVTPKAFELLRVLIDARPRALSKSELHERLWPDTFVSDSTLTSVVAELRDVLGEGARTSRFIRTVFRFGYTFTGQVTDVARLAMPAGQSGYRFWLMWGSGQIALGDGTHLLGRHADVSVWLESPTVSRHHARLCLAGHEATIEDLGSTNGTYLRGQLVTSPSPVHDGDEIRLASIPLRLRALRVDSSTLTEEGCTTIAGGQRTSRG